MKSVCALRFVSFDKEDVASLYLTHALRLPFGFRPLVFCFRRRFPGGFFGGHFFSFLSSFGKADSNCLLPTLDGLT